MMKALRRVATLTVLLLALWLLLEERASADQVVLGLVLALVLALLAPILRPVVAHPRRPLIAARLIWHVARDILHSNWAVAHIILRGHPPGTHAGFLDIPLRIRDPHGLAALACIVTFTPGTVWAGHDAQRNVLTLHVLDLSDPAGLTRVIQMRYEAPLREIFE